MHAVFVKLMVSVNSSTHVSHVLADKHRLQPTVISLQFFCPRVHVAWESTRIEWRITAPY